MESSRPGMTGMGVILPLLDQHDTSAAVIKIVNDRIDFINERVGRLFKENEPADLHGSKASHVLGDDLFNDLLEIRMNENIPFGRIEDPALGSKLASKIDVDGMITEFYKVPPDEILIILHHDIEHLAGLFHNNHNMIISNVRDLIIKVDRNGALMFISNSYSDMFGDHDELLGSDFMHLIHEDDRESVNKAMRSLDDPPFSCTYEERAMTRKGWRWFSWSNRAVFSENGDYDGFIGVGRDVTEEKSMLDALRSSEERYRSTIDAMNDAIHLIDRDYTVLLANKLMLKWAREYGIGEQIVGSNVFNIFPHLGDDVRAEYNKVFSSGKSMVTEEINSVDGWEIVTETRKIPIIEEGEVRKIITIIRDVTEKTKTRDDLVRLNEILKLINKTMRHDIRNRLFVAYGICGLLNEGNKLDREIIGKAYKEIQRSIEITKRMNELEHLMTSESEMIEIDLKSQIESILEDYDIDFSIDGSATIIADAAMESILDNIIGNSLRHGSASNIDIRVEEDVDRVYLRISDDGKGIPNDYKDLIFKEGESFGENKGTGLGLFIVKKTMERYGGDVWVEDNEPRGTTFIMVFPKRV
ncbi:MAG: PAS domain S-box protein [Thermoplasmatota archaeon]